MKHFLIIAALFISNMAYAGTQPVETANEEIKVQAPKKAVKKKVVEEIEYELIYELIEDIKIDDTQITIIA